MSGSKWPDMLKRPKTLALTNARVYGLIRDPGGGGLGQEAIGEYRIADRGRGT